MLYTGCLIILDGKNTKNPFGNFHFGVAKVGNLHNQVVP